MKRIGILGLGNMGEAMLRALLASGMNKADLVGSEIRGERIAIIKNLYDVQITDNPKDLARESKQIVLAVKPQDAKSVLQNLASEMDETKILISIMAGATIQSITSMLGKPAKIVRVMPNICATVAEGAIAMAPNDRLEENELQSVKGMLATLGPVVMVAEEQMDAVTALSGSGPAFVLTFLEALIDGGVRMGLPRDKAHVLAVQTMKGTIAMIEKEGIHPTLIKERVTSPGGTTIAGLVVLEERGFKGTVIRCLQAAQDRARELSK